MPSGFYAIDQLPPAERNTPFSEFFDRSIPVDKHKRIRLFEFTPDNTTRRDVLLGVEWAPVADDIGPKRLNIGLIATEGLFNGFACGSNEVNTFTFSYLKMSVEESGQSVVTSRSPNPEEAKELTEQGIAPEVVDDIANYLGLAAARRISLAFTEEHKVRDQLGFPTRLSFARMGTDV